MTNLHCRTTPDGRKVSLHLEESGAGYRMVPVITGTTAGKESGKLPFGQIARVLAYRTTPHSKKD